MANFLASSADHHETPRLVLKLVVEARRVIKATVALRHPDERVARAALSVLIPHRSLSRADCFILHCLRTGSTYTSVTLERFRRTSNPHCAGSGSNEDIDHVLWACPSYNLQRLKLLAILRAAKRPHMTTDHLLFPTIGERYRVFTFRSVLHFLECNDL